MEYPSHLKKKEKNLRREAGQGSTAKGRRSATGKKRKVSKERKVAPFLRNKEKKKGLIRRCRGAGTVQKKI